MLSSIQRLKNWQKLYGEEFAQKFNEMRLQNYPEVKEIDMDRRRVSHYFHRIRMLHDVKVINKRFVKKLVTPCQIELLIKIIEH